MTTQELNNIYSKLLNDIDFDWLELESSRPNLFNILGAVHNELRHSNMLSWLLNPQESHGIGEAFIKRFVREIAQDDKSEISQIQTENLPFDKVEIRREWNRIDLLMIFPNHVIAIENKIWSKETGDQLKRYKKIVEEHFPAQSKSFVFLTPDGYISDYASDTYINISYQVVVDALSRILEIKAGDLTSRMSVLLEDYLQILNRNIMNDDETVELARKVYGSHKKLFDFVYEHMPDLSVTLRPYFDKKVEQSGWVLGSANKGYIKFQTKEMQDLLPPYTKANGWPLKEPILFEVDYWWNPKPDNSDARISFKVVISPGENEGLIKVLKDTLESVDGAKVTSAKKWLSYFPLRRRFDWDAILEDEENIKEYIDLVWDKIVPIVEKVDKKIMENSDKIKEAVENEQHYN